MIDIIEKRIKDKQERIDKAIEKKEKSIAYFNSLNAAISLLSENIKGRIGVEEMKKDLIYWRDWFYDQWCEWYIDAMYQKVNKDSANNLWKRKKEEIYGAEDPQQTYNKESEIEEIKSQTNE